MESETSKIQLEYSLYETDEVASENDLLMMLVGAYQEVEVDRKRIQNAISVNERTGTFSSLLSGRMRDMLNVLSPDYYLDDSDYLVYKDVILGKYYDQVVRIIPNVNESNFQELAKLASFIREKCFSNCFDVEVLRHANARSYFGEVVDTSNVNIDSEDVGVFFEEELKRITNFYKKTLCGKSYEKK